MQRQNTAQIFDEQSSKATSGAQPRLVLAERAPAEGLSPAAIAIVSEVRRLLSLNMLQSPDFFAGDEDILEMIGLSARKLGFELAGYERDQMLAYIAKENATFGILQTLIDNPEVSDIIVHDFAKIIVQCGRSSVSTDLAFPDQRSYEAYVERLLQRAESTYSTKKPIADGMIGAQIRIHAVHKCLCETGPYLTIRINRMARVGMEDLIASGVAPREVFSYLRKLVRSGLTVFVVGEVGTGKTTLVRALATAMPEKESILVIEDTPEIQLEHPHVRALTTREVNSEGVGRVAPSECIRAGMRMAMNRIIFGEIRDAEAAEAFVDVCASGHPGISTIHARSASEAITRLELFLGRAQRGAERQVIAEQIVTAVQVIIFVDICHVTGKRRIIEVKEIGPVADQVIRQRDIFRYRVENDQPLWRIVTRSSAHREVLERGEDPLCLSACPPTLTLGDNQQFKNYLIPLERGFHD
jgi:pilus assembly protein CpaF